MACNLCCVHSDGYNANTRLLIIKWSIPQNLNSLLLSNEAFLNIWMPWEHEWVTWDCHNPQVKQEEVQMAKKIKTYLVVCTNAKKKMKQSLVITIAVNMLTHWLQLTDMISSLAKCNWGQSKKIQPDLMARINESIKPLWKNNHA